MKNNFLWLAAALLSGAMMAGCQAVKPPMPAESYKYIPARPQISVVNLHADLQVSKLETFINSQLDSVLYEDKSFVDHGGDNLTLKAWKNGTIKMSYEDDLLLWEIPLKVSLRKSYALFLFNIPYGDILEATGEIILRFTTKLSVNRDWHIRTETKPNGYEWVRKPSVKIAGLNIPVKTMVDALLYVNLDSYSRRIDETIAGSFDLRKYAEKGWLMLFDPFKIPGNYNAWLALTPYSVSLLPIKGTKGSIRFRTAITADAECLLDKRPPSGKVSALPSIQPLEIEADTFRINLLTDIPYSTIERMTLGEVKDSIYTFGKRHLRFESFRIYGSNGLMAIETNVKGSINGTMYLTGTPVFNPSDTTLRVKNLKFDLKTKNMLINSARWLMNGRIERSLTKAIAIPFNTNVRDIENQLSAYLKRYQLGYGFEIYGKLSRMTVSDLMLTPESVKANIVFSGDIAIGIGEMTTKK